jgi:hypothetical protein
MTGVLIIVGVVLWFLLPIPICSAIAEKKGYPSNAAGCLGFLLGWFAVLFYALRSDKRRDAEDQAARLAVSMKPGRRASETSGLPSRPDEPATNDGLTKHCPDCAEKVKAAALVCRFCGHKFTIEESKKALEESRAVRRERLLCALASADWQVRISAVHGLRTVGDPSVCQRLFDAMADAVRKAHSWRTDQLLPGIWWDDEVARGTRRFTAAVINALVSFRECGIPYLVKALESRSLHSETADVLAVTGEPVVDLLEKAIPSSEGNVRKRLERIVADIRRKAPRKAG